MDTSDSVCRAQPLLGTFVEIRSAGADGAAAERAIDAAFAAVAKIHRLMSFHDGDSDVSRLNRDACKRTVVVDSWTYEVLKAALPMHRHSEGCFRHHCRPGIAEIWIAAVSRNRCGKLASRGGDQ
jgi:FAD:protein FMN transferase